MSTQKQTPGVAEEELRDITEKFDEYKEIYEQSPTTDKRELYNIYIGINNQLEKLA